MSEEKAKEKQVVASGDFNNLFRVLSVFTVILTGAAINFLFFNQPSSRITYAIMISMAAAVTATYDRKERTLFKPFVAMYLVALIWCSAFALIKLYNLW